MCRVLNIDIGGGTSNYALFDAEKSAAPLVLTSVVACWKPTLRGAWFMPISRGR